MVSDKSYIILVDGIPKPARHSNPNTALEIALNLAWVADEKIEKIEIAKVVHEIRVKETL